MVQPAPFEPMSKGVEKPGPNPTHLAAILLMLADSARMRLEALVMHDGRARLVILARNSRTIEGRKGSKFGQNSGRIYYFNLLKVCPRQMLDENGGTPKNRYYSRSSQKAEEGTLNADLPANAKGRTTLFANAVQRLTTGAHAAVELISTSRTVAALAVMSPGMSFAAIAYLGWHTSERV